jgi:type VI secretion system secreted protein Hcp
MAVPGHLTLTGIRQGVIEGSCDMRGREGTILVEQFDHQVTIPSDPQSGLPTGKRVHKPFKICKYFDKASPKIYQALVTGERMSQVQIKWYRINPGGEEEHYFTHTLEDAIIIDVSPYMPNCLEAAKEQFQHMENVSFTYRKIIWTWVPDGIESEDDWKVPGAGA